MSNSRLSTQPRPISSVNSRGYMNRLPIASEVADANRIFIPPSPEFEPGDLYSGIEYTNATGVLTRRFVRFANHREILIYVDGSSLHNGSAFARAGYGVVFAPLSSSELPYSGRLEQDGNPQTSNRAELRAVLAALTLRFWAAEEFSRIVLACDSEYVVKGISQWIFKWRRNGWRTASGGPVMNQDLWKNLETKLRDMERQGILVMFWKIPRELNKADQYAKIGAEMDPV